MINDKLNDGFIVNVPSNTKWHPTQREDLEFINRIDTTSMESMIYSFKKLLIPKENKVNNVSSRLYDDTINDMAHHVQAFTTSNEAFTYKQMLKEDDFPMGQ